MAYRHTQKGYLILYVMIIISVLFAIILNKTGLDVLTISLMILILFLLSTFLFLTIEIDKDHLHIIFGYGLFRKNFAFSDIKSVRTARTHWYYGWGIRYWPGMWIYNVSGFDAVEITLKDDKRYMLGTDEPERLKNAITDKLSK